MGTELTKARDVPGDDGNDVPGLHSQAQHRRSLLLALPGLLFVGLPMAAIVGVLSGAFAHGLGHQHLLHEVMVGAATVLGGLFAFTAYRGFLADHSAFRYYLTLAFLAETLLYSLHGIFTRWSDTEPLLFLLFGHASRLAMAALLLAAVLALRADTKLAPEKAGLRLWVLAIVVLAGAIAAFALLGVQDQLPFSMRVSLELAAFIVLAAAGSVLLQTTSRITFAVLRSLAAALTLFIMASLAFLLVKAPWDPMFWLAHGIFAAGFLVLGFSVLRARTQVSTLGEVFDLQLMAARLRDRESALAHRESLQRIAAGIAHHINNLMTVVIGNAERLVAVSTDRPAAQRMAEDCLKAGERAAELSRRMAICAGQTSMTPAQLPLDHLLNTIVQRWHDKNGQDVKLKVEHGAPGAMINADFELLSEAVLELLYNGRDALQGKGSLTLKSMTGNGAPGPGFVGIAVVDSGSGMSREVLARAREPFFSTGSLAIHSGLGLSFAEGVANSLGGSVTLESRLGEGTTAIIWLPPARQA
jgi:signal transduction histidine kinase